MPPDLTSANLTEMIARAIRDADKRYFFEDYTTQALAVISTLRRAGLAIVPVTASEEMVEAAKNNLTYGRQRPNEMLQGVYTSMVRFAAGMEKRDR